MAIEVMNAVWKHSKATGRTKLVLLAIADHQGEQGAWPSLATLARMAGASERSVMRDIEELKEIGELEVKQYGSPTKGRNKTNLYFVKLHDVTISQVVSDDVTNQAHDVTKSADDVTAGVIQTLNRNITRNSEHELPEDWQPNEKLLAMFKTKWNLINQERETENFKLYYLEKKTKHKNWDLTFQRWMNQNQQRAEERNSKSQGGSFWDTIE